MSAAREITEDGSRPLGARPSRLARIAWRIWPVLAVSLPAALLWLLLRDGGAPFVYYAFFTVPATLIAMVALSTAGLLPYLRLRESEARAVPTGTLWPLFAHWGFAVATLLTLEQDPPYGSGSSLWGTMTRHDLGSSVMWTMFTLSSLAWLATLLTSVRALPPRE